MSFDFNNDTKSEEESSLRLVTGGELNANRRSSDSIWDNIAHNAIIRHHLWPMVRDTDFIHVSRVNKKSSAYRHNYPIKTELELSEFRGLNFSDTVEDELNERAEVISRDVTKRRRRNPEIVNREGGKLFEIRSLKADGNEDLRRIRDSVRSRDMSRYRETDNDFLKNYSDLARNSNYLQNVDSVYLDSLDEDLEPELFPGKLKSLTIAGLFDKPLRPGDLPESLKHLELGYYFKQPIAENVLPAGLKSLKFSNSMFAAFNQPLADFPFPKFLGTLELGYSFNSPILAGQLPPFLKTLVLGNRFNQPIVNPPILSDSWTDTGYGNFGKVFPNTLKYLDFGVKFNHDLSPGILPSGLETLKFGASYDKFLLSEGVLPSSLKVITVGSAYPFLKSLRNAGRFPTLKVVEIKSFSDLR